MGSTIINTYPPTKKMFGDKEVLKEVWNGETVYELATDDEYRLRFVSDKQFNMKMYSGTISWNCTKVETSTDGRTWTDWDGTLVESAVHDDNKYYLYLRGDGGTKFTGITSSYQRQNTIVFGDVAPFENCRIKVDGNLWSILNYSLLKQGLLGGALKGAFGYLFLGSSRLEDASELKIPIRSEGERVFMNMFKNCTNLLYTPRSVGATNCTGGYTFYGMFEGCTKITEMPEIYGHIENGLAVNAGSFYHMFYGCTKLTTLKSFKEITGRYTSSSSGTDVFKEMFTNCTSLAQLPKIYYPYLDNRNFTSMFQGCTKIKVSETQDSTYKNEYAIPYNKDGTGDNTTATDIFSGTGGTFTGSAAFNTTYYTANEVVE